MKRKFRMDIPETGHSRDYTTRASARNSGRALLKRLIEKGYIFGAWEYTVTDLETRETTTYTID